MRVFWKSMRDNRRTWIGWILALTAIAAMYASFYPSINNPAMADALNSFPPSVKEALHMEDYTKPENYFAVSVFGLLVPILVAVFAISAGVRAIAGDEEAGTLDLVQAQPVSRVSLAQANASRIGHRTHSGFGGQTDFIVGAMHSPGGHAVIALRSWHPKADVSAVVSLLSGPVTSFQHSYIVTEQGTARIWGRDSVEQAPQILDQAAHPAARDGLRAAGRELGLPLT
ncbi:acetyl-CoA hydrolase/transferase C-terminal domain-containing protein [Dactylosporangium sp. NPDC049140]|uniref:acetyl-CoA hydrolase/transferase C-terminal domain-containing protein n=1 Tax=Dactylosporangium sp. NPDC049140 TaxID=3155647 RepID=UPI0033FA034A